MTLALVPKKRGRPPKDLEAFHRRRELELVMAEVRLPDETTGALLLRAFKALLPPVILPSASPEERFFMVYNATKGLPPRKRHATNAQARAEAIRLATKYRSDTFVVLEARWGVYGKEGELGLHPVQFANQAPY